MKAGNLKGAGSSQECALYNLKLITMIKRKKKNLSHRF